MDIHEEENNLVLKTSEVINGNFKIRLERAAYFYGHADQWGEFNGEHKFNIALYAESARVISEPRRKPRRRVA